MISLQQLDEIAHDPLQTHLCSFQGDRGPYPGHPADSGKIQPRGTDIEADNPHTSRRQTTHP